MSTINILLYTNQSYYNFQRFILSISILLLKIQEWIKCTQKIKSFFCQSSFLVRVPSSCQKLSFSNINEEVFCSPTPSLHLAGVSSLPTKIVIKFKLARCLTSISRHNTVKLVNINLAHNNSTFLSFFAYFFNRKTEKWAN